MEKPIYNGGKHTIYVGGYAIEAGATRHIPEHLIPPNHHQANARKDSADMRDLETTPQAASIEEFRAGSLAQIVPLLPDLEDAELDELERLEQVQPSPRKGLLDAITNERLAREARALGD